MKILFTFILTSSLLFPIGSIVIFNDGTKIEGELSSVDESSISITPFGLTFPEQIRMENVDSLKLSNGKVIVASNNVMFFYQNGELIEPKTTVNNIINVKDDYEVEYVLVPNWSINLYTGFPIIKASSFKTFDKSNFLFGLSIGSPFGIFAGDFFMNVIAEFVYYNFQQKRNLDGQNFGGPAIQLGVSPGFFIGQASISLTACTGVYQNDKSELTSGFIAGGSLDIPMGALLDDEDFPIEVRVTGRTNIISKDEGVTGWIDGGVSIGYEF